MATHNATHQMKTLCSTCSLRELCLPVGLMPNEFSQLDAVIRQSRRLKKGEYLFRAGEPFTSLFAIRAGFFKTTVASQDGRDQVTGFFMSGELIGMGFVPIFTAVMLWLWKTARYASFHLHILKNSVRIFPASAPTFFA